MYLVKQKHPIAERYGNTGVLEKHSWSMAFTLLDMDEYDPLHHLPKQRRDGQQFLSIFTWLECDKLKRRGAESDSGASVEDGHDSSLRAHKRVRSDC